jgi:hypothetical protein
MGIVTANPQAALAVGSTQSTVVPRMASVASPMELATTKPLVVPTLLRNAGHQDDIVVPQLASVALPIEMAIAKPTAAPMVMVDSILLMAVEAMGKDQ